MDSQLFTRLLQESEHLVSIEKLQGKEPVTYSGTYSGDYKGKRYSYYASVNNGLAWAEDFAQSIELCCAYEEYIDLYCENKKQGWDITSYEYFWDEQTCEDCEALVAQGVIPSKENFVLERLGIHSGCNA
ncbi:MAG TPA: hypothetical protein V6D33_12340 [Cyanophyceae cyanobacterium]